MQYEILGNNLPVAICRLAGGESVYCESGAMSWMSGSIQMATEGGGLGKLMGRAFSGEAMFRNKYTASSPGEIAFASRFPGEIRAYELNGGTSIIAQKGSFLASDTGVDVSIFFQKKLSSGLLGGEGFIMQKFSGRGTVLMEIDGSAVEYVLQPGERMVVDTGYLVMMDDTCSMEVEMVKGMKNVLFGGEGLFNTIVTGPGRILLQTMPIMKTAQLLSMMVPTKK